MASADEDNMIEFNIGEMGVANTGGSIMLTCNGVKCRLDVPANIPVGTDIRINFKATENSLGNSQIGMSTVNEFHQPDTLMNSSFQPEANKYQQPVKKKKWDGTMSAVNNKIHKNKIPTMSLYSLYYECITVYTE